MAGKQRQRNTNAYTAHNKVRVIRGGADYFDCIERMADSARYSLHLQTYIFDSDETGTRVAEALMRAARRKVQVYVLLDAYASQHFSKVLVARLRESGVHLDYFAPIFTGNFFYMGRRMHHKLVVADAHTCIVAGINISNRYNDMGATKAWLDWALHVEGEAAKQVNDVCVYMWNRYVFRKKIRARMAEQLPLPAEECLVRVRRNDWVYSKTQITRSYRELFQQARQQVTVMTSYFWPPENLLKSIIAASRRGVQVRLILTARADVPFSKYTERYLYHRLFSHNVEIYEYSRNILHGKIGVCDNKWLTAGSYNVNNISAFASVELNLDVRNEAIAREITEKFDKIIAEDCEQITLSGFTAANNPLKLFFYYLSYRATHLIFFLFTFYFTQRRGSR